MRLNLTKSAISRFFRIHFTLKHLSHTTEKAAVGAGDDGVGVASDEILK